MAKNYTRILYQAAVDNGWTPEQVKAATRKQVANACGVDLETVEPSTFLVWNIKRQVIRSLKADAAAAKAKLRRSQILAKVRELSGEINATAEFVKDGETVEGPCIVIRKAE